ncbi:MAG: DUF1735 domain-containing protein [Alistipes finegoldii]
MKLIHKYLILGVAAAGAFTACDNYDADDHKFDNVVYLDVSKTGEVQPATFSNNTPTVEKPIQATLAYPEGQDVAVSLTVDPSLVATYNARYGSDWKMLDAKYYELSSGQRDHPCRQDRVRGGDAPPERADGRRRTADRRAAHRRDLPAAGAHLPFVDVGAERLRGRLLCRQTLFGHHRRGAAYGQLDRIPVARQVRRQQHAVE